MIKRKKIFPLPLDPSPFQKRKVYFVYTQADVCLQLRLVNAIANKKAGSAVAKGYGGTRERPFQKRKEYFVYTQADVCLQLRLVNAIANKKASGAPKKEKGIGGYMMLSSVVNGRAFLLLEIGRLRNLESLRSLKEIL